MVKPTAKNACISKVLPGAKGKVILFTEVSWKKFQEAVPVWNDDIYETYQDHIQNNMLLLAIAENVISIIQINVIWKEGEIGGPVNKNGVNHQRLSKSSILQNE